MQNKIDIFTQKKAVIFDVLKQWLVLDTAAVGNLMFLWMQDFDFA